MNIDNIIEQFNNDLDEWLESEQHLFHCCGYSEGLACCLDKEKNYNSNGSDPNGREFIVEWITNQLMELGIKNDGI